MALRHISIESSDEWEQFLEARVEANFLQSWSWGEFNLARGRKIERIGIYRANTLIGVCLAVVETARRGTYVTVAGGPLIDWDDRELVMYVFQLLRTVAAKHTASFVRIRPQALDTPQLRDVFKKHGLRPSPMHLTADLTSQLDLSPTPDALMASMRKSTRYEIRKAQKMGVSISTSVDPKDIQEFYDVQLETAKRQHFVPFSLEFLQKQFAEFAKAQNVLLYRAYFEDELLALAFVIFYNHEGVYHYGASTEAGRKAPGAYLIQWEAICEARRRGCLRYNFWGVTPPDVANHRFSSISLFKRGFGGEDVAYLPAHDLVVSPISYAANYLVETMRRRMRKL